jgi:hypothetical protein
VIRKDRNFSIGSNNGFAIRHTNYNVLMSDWLHKRDWFRYQLASAIETDGHIQR